MKFFLLSVIALVQLAGPASARADEKLNVDLSSPQIVGYTRADSFTNGKYVFRDGRVVYVNEAGTITSVSRNEDIASRYAREELNKVKPLDKHELSATNPDVVGYTKPDSFTNGKYVFRDGRVVTVNEAGTITSIFADHDIEYSYNGTKAPEAPRAPDAPAPVAEVKKEKKDEPTSISITGLATGGMNETKGLSIGAGLGVSGKLAGGEVVAHLGEPMLRLNGSAELLPIALDATPVGDGALIIKIIPVTAKGQLTMNKLKKDEMNGQLGRSNFTVSPEFVAGYLGLCAGCPVTAGAIALRLGPVAGMVKDGDGKANLYGGKIGLSGTLLFDLGDSQNFLELAGQGELIKSLVPDEIGNGYNAGGHIGWSLSRLGTKYFVRGEGRIEHLDVKRVDMPNTDRGNSAFVGLTAGMVK